MIKARCGACGQKMAVPDESVGKKGKCPNCGQVILVETASLLPVPVSQPNRPPRRSEPERDAADMGEVNARGTGDVDDDLSRRAPERDDEGDDGELDERSHYEPAPPRGAAMMPRGLVPAYRWLAALGWAAMGLGVAVILLSCFTLMMTLEAVAGGAPVEELAAVAPPGVAGVAGGVLLMCVGAIMLALRDVARNSWFARDTAELLRTKL